MYTVDQNKYAEKNSDTFGKTGMCKNDCIFQVFIQQEGRHTTDPLTCQTHSLKQQQGPCIIIIQHEEKGAGTKKYN